jgi:hypothetical protein
VATAAMTAARARREILGIVGFSSAAGRIKADRSQSVTAVALLAGGRRGPFKTSFHFKELNQRVNRKNSPLKWHRGERLCTATHHCSMAPLLFQNVP